MIDWHFGKTPLGFANFFCAFRQVRQNNVNRPISSFAVGQKQAGCGLCFYRLFPIFRQVPLRESPCSHPNDITQTPFGHTLGMIQGKRRLIILYWLVECDCVRFNELQRLSVQSLTDPKHAIKRHGKRRTDYTHRIPANSAQSGIQPVGQG